MSAVPSSLPSARLPVRYLSSTTCCGTPLHIYGCLLPAEADATRQPPPSTEAQSSEPRSTTIGMLAVLPYRASTRSARMNRAPDVEPLDFVARMDDILQHRSVSFIVVHETDVLDVNETQCDGEEDAHEDVESKWYTAGKPRDGSGAVTVSDSGAAAANRDVQGPRRLRVKSGLLSFCHAIHSDTVQHLVNLLSVAQELVDPVATPSISGALESRREGLRRVAALFATSIPVLQALPSETVEDGYRLREELATTFVSVRMDESMELARLPVDAPSETTHTFVEDVFAEIVRAAADDSTTAAVTPV